MKDKFITVFDFIFLEMKKTSDSFEQIRSSQIFYSIDCHYNYFAESAEMLWFTLTLRIFFGGLMYIQRETAKFQDSHQLSFVLETLPFKRFSIEL